MYNYNEIKIGRVSHLIDSDIFNRFKNDKEVEKNITEDVDYRLKRELGDMVIEKYATKKVIYRYECCRTGTYIDKDYKIDSSVNGIRFVGKIIEYNLAVIEP